MNIGRWFVKFLADLTDSLKFVGQDFVRGKAFWIPVVAAIIPCIIGETKLGLNLPRLVTQATVSSQEFESGAGTMLSRDEFLAELQTQIQQTLIDSVGFPFRGKQDNVVQSSREKVAEVKRYSSKARFSVKAQVTNIGAVTSTVSYVSVLLMESIGGRYNLLGFSSWPQEEIKLPPGQITKLGNPEGQRVEFDVFRNGFTDYQVVESIGRALHERYPKETTRRYEMLKAYLRLFAVNDVDRQERLVRIADQANHARVYLLLKVNDIYGRTGTAEAFILDCGAWK